MLTNLIHIFQKNEACFFYSLNGIGAKKMRPKSFSTLFHTCYMQKVNEIAYEYFRNKSISKKLNNIKNWIFWKFGHHHGALGFVDY